MHERIIELKVIAQYIDSLQQNPKSKERIKEPAGMEPMLALDKSKQVAIYDGCSEKPSPFSLKITFLVKWSNFLVLLLYNHLLFKVEEDAVERRTSGSS